MSVQLYNNDCLIQMSLLMDNSIDLILCDLPYGSTQCPWDVVIPFNCLWEQYNRVLKNTGNIVLFSSGKFTFDLFESNKDSYRYKMIWSKNVPTGMSGAKYMPMKYYEEILIFKKPNSVVSKITYNPQQKERVGKHKECYNYTHYCGNSNHVNYEKIEKKYDPEKVNPSDVLSFNVVPNRSGKLHPTQKPVDLLEYLIRTYSNENDIVLDNCMGSGTTGVACLHTDRNFIGIELDERYFKIAQDRIYQEEKQLKSKLF